MRTIGVSPMASRIVSQIFFTKSSLYCAPMPTIDPRANRHRCGHNNAWLTLNSPFLIELIGEAGWDCLTIDQQHGLGGNDVLMQCLTAAKACGMPAIVRVAENDPALSGGRSMPGRKGSCAL